MTNQSKLKAYVRYDGTGRVIAGGPILQRFKPKVGNWVEIQANECCNEPNFGDYLITQDNQPLITENDNHIILN